MEKIFASPQEPLFRYKDSGVTPDLLQSWLEQLSHHSACQTKSAQKSQGLFKAGDYVEFLFLTCDKLRISPDAKYLALEIFDRFMMQHIQDLYDYVEHSKSDQKNKEWLNILDSVQNQVKLRIVSCCQIASKVNMHYKGISNVRVKKFLRMNGHHYTSDGILSSELRILKTLNFCVTGPTSLTFIEIILEILGYNEPSMEVKLYYSVATSVLDVVFVQFHAVYKRLHDVIMDSPTKKRLDLFECVKADKMLLAVAVITTAVHVVDPEQCDKVIRCLSRITRVPEDDIIDFGTVIVQHIIETK